MKVYFSTFLLCLSFIYLRAQNGGDIPRYFNTIFEDIEVTSNIVYTEQTTIGGNKVSLEMDIYEPNNDPMLQRPLLVFAHGGGFVGGHRSRVEDFCQSYAKRGFVVANISYRLLDTEYSMETIGTVSVMAMHDMKSAIRFLRADAANKNTYHIDPNLVFVGGISAGAIMACSVGYIDNEDRLNPFIQSLLNTVGGLEGVDTKNSKYPSTVQGVINFSGGLIDSKHLDANDPPLYSFHDEFDPVVACGASEQYVLHGSCLLHDQAVAVGLKNKLFFNDKSKRHVGWNEEQLQIVLNDSAGFLGELINKVSDED
ncbi:MAG: alpha/beta hydrolase [Saprospiraceae bacterium]|nr:alpha/beta hydrolase [Saprospiraceae bacterium]